VVGSHEEDTAFLRAHSIEGVQESGEGDALLSALLLDSRSFDKNAIDIF